VVPATAILWFDITVVVGFHHALLPKALRLAYYALYFGAGLWARRLTPDGTAMGGAARTPLLLAGLTYCAMLPMIHIELQTPLSLWPRLALSFLLVAFAWLMSWGLLRVAFAW